MSVRLTWRNVGLGLRWGLLAKCEFEPEGGLICLESQEGPLVGRFAGPRRMQMGTGLGAGTLVGGAELGVPSLLWTSVSSSAKQRVGCLSMAWGSLLNPAGPWVPSQTYCSALDGGPKRPIYLAP